MISDINWIKRMLSHNVRMPISIILGYGQLIENGLLSADEQKQVIKDICENLEYINDVMKVVLDDGEEEEHEEAVNIVDVIEKSTRFVNEVARKIPVSIDIRSEKSKMLVKAEYFPLMRVFYQLFENSFKYIGNGDSIKINAFYAGDNTILVVFKDNGIGMSEKDRRKIFEKGFRGANSKGKTGSGYGLFEVKNTLEKYGATIEISSRENMGFSAYMIFPAFDGAETEKEVL